MEGAVVLLLLECTESRAWDCEGLLTLVSLRERLCRTLGGFVCDVGAGLKPLTLWSDRMALCM